MEDFPDMWERFIIASVKSSNLDDKLLSVSKRKGLFFLNVFFLGDKIQSSVLKENGVKFCYSLIIKKIQNKKKPMCCCTIREEIALTG